jgi:hypothetical protein
MHLNMWWGKVGECGCKCDVFTYICCGGLYFLKLKWRFSQASMSVSWIPRAG